MNNENETLYTLADRVMRDYIKVYLELIKATKGLSDIKEKNASSLEQKLIILGGISSPLNPANTSAADIVQEWERLKAIPFDIEQAITMGVYIELRSKVKTYLDQLDSLTKGYMVFSPELIVERPYFLPIFQRLANLASKAALKKKIGSVSDNSISKNAATKLSELLNTIKPGRVLNREQVLQSVEPTLEGIVRDLVGRVLLESIVANALDLLNLPYKRENEYSSLKGVIYDFRADFVVPNEESPMAFIEVRKSSSRHASLYAKDKMFCAINWKGKNKTVLAILVVDGPWTAQTLKAMARIFDYVVPMTSVSQVAEVISDYLKGDKTKLKWLVEFSIKPSNEAS